LYPPEVKKTVPVQEQGLFLIVNVSFLFFLPTNFNIFYFLVTFFIFFS